MKSFIPKINIRNRGTVRKHEEFYSKNKHEKLVSLVGFIIRTGLRFFNSFFWQWGMSGRKLSIK
jgi:hypothetical protein